MRIAYLINQYPKISHSFIRREIKALESLGCSVVRFSIRECQEELIDEADQQEKEKTFVILSLGLTGLLFPLISVILTQIGRFLAALNLTVKIGLKSERGLLIHLVYLAEACLLLQQLKKLNIYHIHAHFGTNSTTVALLCSVLGEVSYSFTVHGPEEFDKVQAIALPEKIKRSAFVVAVSSFGKSQLYRWCESSQWSKIQVIHCGLDDIFLNTSPPPIEDKPKLVCVGRLSEQKGQLLLVEAIHQLTQQGIHCELLLVGDGELRNNIETLIEKWSLTEYIKITGWATTEAVRQHILAAKVMVLPSFAEGLPVVLMESLALGRPVISTYIAGIPELVNTGECGWLVPAGSVDALVTTLQTVLELPVSQLEKMGQLGRQRVIQEHNVLEEAEKLIKLFKTVEKQ